MKEIHFLDWTRRIPRSQTSPMRRDLGGLCDSSHTVRTSPVLGTVGAHPGPLAGRHTPAPCCAWLLLSLQLPLLWQISLRLQEPTVQPCNPEGPPLHTVTDDRQRLLGSVHAPGPLAPGRGQSLTKSASPADSASLCPFLPSFQKFFLNKSLVQESY